MDAGGRANRRSGGRNLERQGGIAKEYPSTADIGIGDAGFGLEDGGTEGNGRIRF